jgi:hypothetical protein
MSVKVTFQKNMALTNPRQIQKKKSLPLICDFHSTPQFPSAIGWRKKNTSYNHKTTIWVSHEYYLNPEFHKILWSAF